MKKLTVTALELRVATAFAETSLGTCGAFDEDDNLSYMNAQDLAEQLELSAHVIAGVMSSLSKKDLIMDLGESYRGAKINDWMGLPESYAGFEQLAYLVTADTLL
jgi:hypothetical protein